MKNLAENELLIKLNQLYLDTQSSIVDNENWKINFNSYSKTIDNILIKHHSFLYNELQTLNKYIVKIKNIYGANHKELVCLSEKYQILKLELIEHALKEESEVFPTIKVFESNPALINKTKLKTMMAELKNEHDITCNHLMEMRKMTNDYLLTETCMTYQLTFKRLKSLENGILQHIHLENQMLFRSIENQLKKDS
ncbi:hemerythrin domain-containing protein [Alkalihalobacillus sp. BA299]|uniref:hemerythrin domain-containing protein n=1 Tax=Alkalihalobacillus sp. BA299 TaxID=2815938 RepID=UPI001ADD5FF4|nr:hemerythrin domain-containing protein [Alkalihalobacillus sp. BA299]